MAVELKRNLDTISGHCDAELALQDGAGMAQVTSDVGDTVQTPASGGAMMGAANTHQTIPSESVREALGSVELPKAAGDTGAAPPEAPPQIVRADGAASVCSRRRRWPDAYCEPATGTDAEHAADGEPASKKAKTEVHTPTRTAHPALASSPESTLNSQKGKGKGKQAKRTSDMAQEDGPTEAAEEQPKKPKKETVRQHNAREKAETAASEQAEAEAKAAKANQHWQKYKLQKYKPPTA